MGLPVYAQDNNSSDNSLEQAGYFKVPDAHLYTVLHGVRDPVARVLLVGPFASERHYSYIPWVRWARYLAARRIECLRYDYRGVGESTGVFEDMSFENWIEDVELLAAWLKARSPHVPLLLHGLELGALLASNPFKAGVGEAMLLWAPSANANQVLRATVTRRVSMDNAFKCRNERKPLAHYLKQLENNHVLEVEGYRWSGRLWLDSFRFELQSGREGQCPDGSVCNRPFRIVELDQLSTPLIKGSPVHFEAINKSFTRLFTDNFEWIATALATPQGREL